MDDLRGESSNCSTDRGGSSSKANRAAEALSRARVQEPFGHQVHTILAMIYLFLLPLATAPKDVAFGVLSLWAIFRFVTKTWRSYHKTAFDSLVMWGLLTWAIWYGISLFWSENVEQGLDEIQAFRVLFTPLLLWPILDRIPWLIGSALLGVFSQNLIQMSQELNWFGLEPGEDHRLRGLIHPIQSGAWFVAAILWHLSAVMKGRGWIRWVSSLLLLIAMGGLIATGSRGPWIAAAISLPLMLIITFIRRPQLRKVTVLIGVLCVIGFVATWLVDHSRIQPRIEEAIKEINNARNDHVYWTSVGLRVALWQWAIEVFQQSPIGGAGAGGFSTAYVKLPSFEQARENAVAMTRSTEPKQKRATRVANERIAYMTRDHAHSTYMQTLAQLGFVGFAILLFVLIQTLWRSWVDPPDHVFSEGTLFVAISWMVGAQFDCYELGGLLLGLFAFVIAITLPYRPRIRYHLSEQNDNDHHQQDA